MTTVAPAFPLAEPGGTARRTFSILSSFPPTPCGIATFSAALAAGLIGNGATVDVVRCGSVPDMEDPLVMGVLESGNRHSLLAALEVLNGSDVALVQHEYGLYDGPDGEGVLEVIDAIDVPLIVVAHTVVTEPTPNQRRVLEQICRSADLVVVMTETARVRLLTGFDVDETRVIVVPHGAATPLSVGVDPQRGTNPRPRLLTWGLLGPGKGIEWAIDALAQLSDLDPRPAYVIAGATHPKVLAASGEAYREGLRSRAEQVGVGASVSFDPTYRDLESLTRMITSADLVVLPYDSKDQVTSGVLVDAIAAGRPVISTAFPHAVELLASGAGIVVPQRDPVALARAIRSALTDPGRLRAMGAEARRLAPDLSWPSVAGRYEDLAGQLINDRTAVPT